MLTSFKKLTHWSPCKSQGFLCFYTYLIGTLPMLGKPQNVTDITKAEHTNSHSATKQDIYCF